MTGNSVDLRSPITQQRLPHFRFEGDKPIAGYGEDLPRDIVVRAGVRVDISEEPLAAVRRQLREFIVDLYAVLLENSRLTGHRLREVLLTVRVVPRGRAGEYRVEIGERLFHARLSRFQDGRIVNRRHATGRRCQSLRRVGQDLSKLAHLPNDANDLRIVQRVGNGLLERQRDHLFHMWIRQRARGQGLRNIR